MRTEKKVCFASTVKKYYMKNNTRVWYNRDEEAVFEIRWYWNRGTKVSFSQSAVAWLVSDALACSINKKQSLRFLSDLKMVE